MLDLGNLTASDDPVKKWKVDELSVLVYESPELMVKNVALSVQKYLQQCLIKQDTATVILATGNSQIKFLENLIKLGGLDWSKIVCFHLDEFLGISAQHPGSFRKYLQERVEKKVNLKAFHYLQGDTWEPISECDRYTQLLQAQPIDLCCLGIGENGHIAFNEPEVAQVNDPRWVKIVKLAETTVKQQVNGIYFSSIETVPNYAFTLTLPAICQSRKIVCLAAGKSKSSLIKSVLQNPRDLKFPASILRTQPQATLFIDQEAANYLYQPIL
ncbi:glucosamine-6-phosphate deaminase [Merismopedia glauca]|uniref:Glucosamine-6-phosphate deaminase n=1 Tax=Merismopedia glauca CCAP 1448/3 TaxID=1296344 RepID=A0A2T1C6X6_9CYAN|nr:glucosamine-6-phosphate deaminase [Merismopedia glauca]PSB03897.1 glucosamine-6-phosphate deaminase [Merismopedia glauca CCAP 1448/3]